MSENAGAKGKHSGPRQGNIYARANEVIVHALAPDQLMDAELTRKIALAHDTVMVEAAPGGRGKGTILG